MQEQEYFLAENTKDGGFLQSIFWKKFLFEAGKKVFYWERDKFNGLFVEHSLPLVGSYWFCPRGPIGKNEKAWLNLGMVFNKARENKVGWLRLEPQDKNLISFAQKEFPFKILKAPNNHEPEETLMINLSKNLDQILKEMKSKTRYNIRLSQKKEILIKEDFDKNDFENFWRLLEETSKRDKINLHPKRYYQEMLRAIPRDKIKLITAYFKKEMVAGIIVSFYGGVATYLHGASSSHFRNLMANYGLQWRAIEMAKEMGMKKYDLGGTAINLNKKNWQGITKFKRGFCPYENPVEFPGCYDFVIDKRKYFLYRTLHKIKSIF
jgi:lipid II:glycine glycyltransferase (peptidoglycan interpeptide bridge formation enzyme)